VLQSNFDEAEKIIGLLESGQLEIPNSEIEEEPNNDPIDDLDHEDLLED